MSDSQPVLETDMPSYTYIPSQRDQNVPSTADASDHFSSHLLWSLEVQSVYDHVTAEALG